MPTSASILTAIGEIITGAKYKANQMRPLLQNIFNVSSSFYSGTSDPGSSNDNTQNYRIGSLGRNTNTGRYFICVNANTGAAVWDSLNDDFLVSEATFADGSTTIMPFRTAYFIATTSGSVDEAVFQLPLPSYAGKSVKILVLGAVTTGITVVNEATSATQTTIDACTSFASIELICNNVTTQAWEVVAISFQ